MEEDISIDLTELQSSLEKAIARVEERNSVWQQFQAFQTSLLSVDSLPEMIDTTLAQAKSFFKQETVNLTLLNADSKITTYLQESNYDYRKNKQLVLLNDKASLPVDLVRHVFIGRYEASKHAAFFAHPPKQITDVILIPLIRHGELLGVLSLACEKSTHLPDKTKLDLVAQIGLSISICLENHLNFAIARQAYRNEALANANNRRFLEQRLVEELERGQRSTDSLSCILLDVAFPAMKKHEETAQLEVQVLKTVAETAKRQLRVGDVFSYYEGRKFAMFLTNAPEAVVAQISERLKTTILEQVINFANQIIPLTITMGFASYAMEKNPADKSKTHQQIALDLMAAADASLHQAKHNTSPPKKIIAS